MGHAAYVGGETMKGSVKNGVYTSLQELFLQVRGWCGDVTETVL